MQATRCAASTPLLLPGPATLVPDDPVVMQLQAVLSGQPVAVAGWDWCHPVEQAVLLSWVRRGVTRHRRQDRIDWIATWCADGTLPERISNFGRSRLARRGHNRLSFAMSDDAAEATWAAAPARLKVLYEVWVGSVRSTRESLRRAEATVLWAEEGSLQAHVSDQRAAQIISDLGPPL